jgi:hypothetical protein
MRVRASSIERIGIQKTFQRKFINSRSGYHLRNLLYDAWAVVATRRTHRKTMR